MRSLSYLLSLLTISVGLSFADALLPALVGPSKAFAQSTTPSTAITLLDVQGVLEPGDAVLAEDNTLYDEYTFEGRAGQRISIVMESLVFDTYLLLLDATGKTIAQNDDYRTAGNAALILTLPQDGTYRVIANAYGPWSRGRYRLTVVETAPQQTEPILSPVANQQIRAAQLNRQGVQKLEGSNFQAALQDFEQALPILREVGDRRGEGTTLNSIGAVYDNLGQYPQALDFYQQALTILKEVGDRTGEGTTLNNIGAVYRNLGQYPQALDFYQQALAIRKEVGDRTGEGTTLNNIGAVYTNLGQYPQALDFYQQALAIRKEVGDRRGEGTTLNNIGGVYRNLGQYPHALNFYQQALAIRKEVGDRRGEGTTLNNIGGVYDNLGQYPQALDFYQQALTILKEVGDRTGEGTTLNNIGGVYANLGQYPQALDFYQQALAIRKEVGDRTGEGTTLNNIGLVYANLGQYPQALDFYQQALAITKEVDNRTGEGTTLNNIGYLLNKLNQPELAIVFYKQSVNLYEEIRQELRVLPREQQESYIRTIESTYRNLADILLRQNRVLEAQLVLDLLKVQELDDYLRGVQRNAASTPDATLRPAEAETLRLYEASERELIALGRELTQLSNIPVAQRTAAQTARITELRRLEEAMRLRLRQFFERPEVVALVAQLRQTTQAANVEIAQLNQLRDNLRRLQQQGQNAVVLYPLVLEDRLELVLVTADAPPIRRTANVKREDLNRAIAQFRSALQSPSSDPRPVAQQLYTWLIRPIEADLTQAQANTIIYAPDAQLRYIPLAALYDGQQWLVQRYRVNNITAASLSDLETHPAMNNPSILAGVFSQGSYQVRVGDRTFTFNGLRYAGQEVQNLTQLIPQTVRRIDGEFTPNIVYEMNDYRIVHLATHAAFNPGPPENSFILFGNGDRRDLTAMKDWSFPDVELVVLSACETAVGDVPLGNGTEILGFGYLMQAAGAEAAIASLWSVSDGGTQALMDAFYAALRGENVTKAEALRRAQIALITGDFEALENSSRGIIGVRQRIREGVPTTVLNRLSHPYYWAPFILIGNGL